MNSHRQETNTKIGVFFGSRSPEHDVSIITAELIMKGLSGLGYTVYPVYVSDKGKWYIDERLMDIDFFKQDDYREQLQKFDEYTLDVTGGESELVFTKKGGWNKKEIRINLVFPAFHGPYGEDGTFQGLCEMFDVAYVGCGVSTSAITMDKVLTKLLYQRYNIPTTEFVSFTRSEWGEYQSDILEQVKHLRLPVFVKPARAGSSIGITKVEQEQDLETAVEVALHYDTKVLVEKAVEHVADLTVCVIGNDDLRVSLVQESKFAQGFFTYDDKYLSDGGAQLGRATKNIDIPAQISEDLTQKIQNMARDVYVMFECSGIARIDFLLNRESEAVFVNEINALPGTLYHHLWRASGVDLSKLLKDLIRFAKERHASTRGVSTRFSSGILAKLDSAKLSSKLSPSSDQ